MFGEGFVGVAGISFPCRGCAGLVLFELPAYHVTLVQKPMPDAANTSPKEAREEFGKPARLYEKLGNATQA